MHATFYRQHNNNADWQLQPSLAVITVAPQTPTAPTTGSLRRVLVHPYFKLSLSVPAMAGGNPTLHPNFSAVNHHTWVVII